MAVSLRPNQDVKIKFSRTVESIEIYREGNNILVHDDNLVKDLNGEKTAENVNPKRFTIWQWIKMACMTPIALIRFILILMLVCLAYVLSRIGLIGVSESDLTDKPFTGWRRKLQNFILSIGRALFFCMGVHHIEIVGTKASRNDAPIFVGGPHATFLDAIAVAETKSIFLAETKNWRMAGAIGQFLQVLFVDRLDQKDRKNMREQISTRASDQFGSDKTGNGSWRQIFIFPEGTTTDGHTLLKFKTGAFSPGLPVQMVLIRMVDRNVPNTLTFAWRQGQKRTRTPLLLWTTLCQLRTRVQIEFLPVYKPSEDERKDPTLYAENVRKLMAAKLNVSMSELSVDDIINKKKF